MRTLILCALLATGLFAQTPDDPAARWQRTRQEILNLLPRSHGNPGLPLLGSRFDVARSDVRRQVVLAPGRACAIPLLDVSPKGGFTGDPKMAIPLAKGGDRMPIIQPPAPSCADVTR